MFMSAAAMGTWLTIPLVMARFINAAQDAVVSSDLWRSGVLLGLSVLLGIVGWFFHGPARVLEMISGFVARRNIQLGLLTQTTKLPAGWHQTHHSGETIDQVSRSASALADFTETATLVLQVFARFIGAVLMMSIFMPSAGLIVIANAILVVGVVTVFDKRLVPMYESGNKVQNKVASKVQDYLTNIRTVISLRLEDRVVEEVSHQLDRLRPITEQASVTQEIKWFVANLLVDLTRAVTLFGFVFLTIRAGKRIEVGALFALNEYLIAIGTSFFELTWRWGDLVIKATKLRAVEHIERDYEQLVNRAGDATLPKGWQEVRLRSVSFRHTDSTHGGGGVHGVDLTLTKGRSYAIVGGSGSGKSTLLGLLRGLNTAMTGAVVCDGVEMPHGLASVSHVTTLVPQDPEVFADTVLKNVTMGIEAPSERILAAIAMAGFSEVLARLPRGLDTNIAEKGVSLSGGEKQRLALARGIFFAFDGESEIILLDESTSGVDVVKEKRIYEGVLRHFSRQVVVATTHKFNLLPLFDEIIVMERGRVVERGTLAELLQRDGVFSAMWSEFSGAQTALEAVV
jgi:ABC-type multidrug transport system fused ATPase/permease subunit